jgi:hypothetical protein
MAPRSGRGQKLKKNPPNATKGLSPNTQKNPCMLLYCYQNSKMICRTSSGIPITFKFFLIE